MPHVPDVVTTKVITTNAWTTICTTAVGPQRFGKHKSRGRLPPRPSACRQQTNPRGALLLEYNMNLRVLLYEEGVYAEL